MFKKLPLVQIIYKSPFSLLLFSWGCGCTKHAGVIHRFCRRHSLLRQRCGENARWTYCTDQVKLNQQSKVKLVLRAFALENGRGGKRGAPPLPLCSKRKGLGTRLEKKAFTTRRVCLVSVQPFPSGQFTSVTYPRGTGGKHSLLRSDQMTRNELAARNNEG